jgi:hypothetical protein
MLEMGTSGLMSGEGKRARAVALGTAPFLDSTCAPTAQIAGRKTGGYRVITFFTGTERRGPLAKRLISLSSLANLSRQ